MTTNNQKLLIALTNESYITATKSKILDPTFSSSSELTITNLKTKKSNTFQCTSKFDHLYTFGNITLGILENGTAEIYTDKLVMSHELKAPYAFAYNAHKKMLAVSNPLTLINTVDFKIYNPGDFKHNFRCLSWNNKVHHILATIADNKIIILDLKNKKEVVNVSLDSYNLTDANSLMWHWSELTSLIIGCKTGTYKINLSDNTTVKISSYGEKVIFSDYLVCTDYKNIEFYDKEYNLVLSKEMNICDFDVNQENIAITYMDRKLEIAKKSRFVERYAASKQINFFYFDNKCVVGLKGKYKIVNPTLTGSSNFDDLTLIRNAVEGKDVDVLKYMVNLEDHQETLTIATIRKIVNNETFTVEEYKKMSSALVILLSEYANDFTYIVENVGLDLWANLVDAINKSKSTEKKKYYTAMINRLEAEGMKEEAMIVCVYSQDFEKLCGMQIDLLGKPKTYKDINTYFERFGYIVEKFSALNVSIKSNEYKQYINWVNYNDQEKQKGIDKQLSNLQVSSTQPKPSIGGAISSSIKQNLYNSANYTAYQKQKPFVHHTPASEPEMAKQPNSPIIPPKTIPNFIPPKHNFVQHNQPSSFSTPFVNGVSQGNVQATKPKMTYGQINQQQVKNVLNHSPSQRSAGNLQSPTLGQRSVQSVVPPIPILTRPAQNLVPPIKQRPAQGVKPTVLPQSITKPAPPPRQPPNSPSIVSPQTNIAASNHKEANNVSNNILSEEQRQEYLNAIQSKINYLITESNKKNGFFHKNKISSSMKRLQFYEINKDSFSDNFLINLHELMCMIDEEGCTNMLEKYKAKIYEMNGVFGNFCGFDVFGLGLLGLYQVVLSEKK